MNPEMKLILDEMQNQLVEHNISQATPRWSWRQVVATHLHGQGLEGRAYHHARIGGSRVQGLEAKDWGYHWWYPSGGDQALQELGSRHPQPAIQWSLLQRCWRPHAHLLEDPCPCPVGTMLRLHIWRVDLGLWLSWIVPRSRVCMNIPLPILSSVVFLHVGAVFVC